MIHSRNVTYDLSDHQVESSTTQAPSKDSSIIEKPLVDLAGEGIDIVNPSPNGYEANPTAHPSNPLIQEGDYMYVPNSPNVMAPDSPSTPNTTILPDVEVVVTPYETPPPPPTSSYGRPHNQTSSYVPHTSYTTHGMNATMVGASDPRSIFLVQMEKIMIQRLYQK